MLKHRQITAIDKIPLVSVPYWKWNKLGKDLNQFTIDKIPLESVPYWEWDKLGKDCFKKQQYLKSLIGI
ncbi:hypothetical protein ACHAWO_007975 [Cyclotella atomus]|uniref:Uncharacterized protein n=1 Tax=Cyclotella atomus TaxID=382360 RepID=A0ABD3MZM6_9STRA